MANDNLKKYLRETQDISLGEILPEYRDITQEKALRNAVYDWNKAHRSAMQQRLFDIGSGVQDAGILSGAFGVLSAPFSFKYGLLGMGLGATSAYLGSKIKRSTTPDKYKDYLDDALDLADTKHRRAVDTIIESRKFRKDLDDAYFAAMRNHTPNSKPSNMRITKELIDEASGLVDYGKVFKANNIPFRVQLVKPIPSELQPLYENHLRTLEEYRRKANKRH